MARTTCASGKKRARNLEEDRVSQIDSTPWKSRGRYFEEEDQISQLPDEILIFILCHCQLSLKEAASTCILSKRWEYLWTYIKVLNFPSSETYIDILRLTKSQDVESNRYVKWVTKVLDSHRGSTIDELRVRFPLDCNYSSHIDNWIDSAIRKRVKMLEMDFSPWFGGYPNLRYTFPGKSFSQSCIKLLTFLSLKYVNVTGELIDHFLSCCPLLEQLFLAGSENLVNLKVYGSSLRLRNLEIVSCRNLEAVEIFAPNLLSFFYFGVGQRTKILIEHAPSLVDVFVGDYLASVVSYALNPFFSCFSQLETLTLCMTLHREAISLPQFPELTSLKNLILRVHAGANDSLLSWASLINGSPFLQRFTLQLTWIGRREWRSIQKAAKSPHQCLKVVELVGFVGRMIDIELALYFIKNATALDKIIIDPHEVTLRGIRHTFDDPKKEQAARRRAVRLKTKLPRRVKLVIR